jgi:transcriptional regulator of acetoin/glycerol metabolism
LKPDDIYLRNTNTTISIESITTLEEMEMIMIRQALDKNSGNFSAAAEQLGITRQTLYNRLRKSPIDDQ